jgi:hypothetical protein
MMMMMMVMIQMMVKVVIKLQLVVLDHVVIQLTKNIKTKRINSQVSHRLVAVDEIFYLVQLWLHSAHQ